MILDDLAAQLVAGGHGVINTTLFLGRMPDAPDTCYVLREYPGSAPIAVHNAPGKGVDRYSVQLVVRAATQSVAREAIFAAWRTLRQIRNLTISGTRYLWVADNHPPFPLRTDASDRWEFAVNFSVGVSEEP